MEFDELNERAQADVCEVRVKNRLVKHYPEYSQFIRAVLRFGHPVTNMKLTDDLISSHSWVWISSCNKNEVRSEKNSHYHLQYLRFPS